MSQRLPRDARARSSSTAPSSTTSSDDTGALAEQKEIPIFSGSIPPGDHTVQVLVNCAGNGYGVFSYLRGYKFEVRPATRSPSTRARPSSSTPSPTRRAA